MTKKGNFENLKGMRFNRPSVLEFSETRNRTTFWKCKCDCGNETIVSSYHLKSGHTKSCGCLNRERIRMQNFKNGLTNTKLHYTYLNMCNRCNRKTNEMYYLYGGRGIKVCEEWLGENGFVNFANWAIANGYKEGLQIDRIDNENNYSPDNCRWVSRIVQANNKRNNVYVKINGEIDTVGNMARKHDISYWNLLHYAKGGKNTMYPHLEIEVINIEQSI